MKNIFTIIFLGLGLLSCSKTEETKAEENFGVSEDGNEIVLTDAQMKNVGIQVASLENKDIATKIMLTGAIDIPPKATANVSAPSGGYAKTSKFLIGNYVKKGDVLVILEDPNVVQLQQEYLLAKSNLAYAQKDYVRQKELNESQASSDKTMQMAQTEANNQRVMVKAMAERLRILGINPDNLNTNNIQKTIAVRAPISGYISAVNFSLGQYVSPADVLFEIVNTNEKQLILKVFEKDLGKIQIGQKVYAYSNQNPEKKFLANVFLIGKDFEADKSVLVYCRMVENSESLIPGTFMNAEIETNMQTGQSLPEDAVVSWEGKQYVFEEIKSKTYRMVEVKIGNTENGYTEILENSPKFLKKKIVVKGAYPLLMGLKNVEE